MGTSLFANWVSVVLWSAADRPARSYQPTYIGLGLLSVLLVVVLIKAYRVWEEIHDVEEPASPEDILASFEQAHAAGELDDEELQRVRVRLGRSSTSEGHSATGPAEGGSSESLAPGPLSDLPKADEGSARRQT
jgi:hypothetical protein